MRCARCERDQHERCDGLVVIDVGEAMDCDCGCEPQKLCHDCGVRLVIWRDGTSHLCATCQRVHRDEHAAEEGR